MITRTANSRRLLLVGGLGTTDLSGKVPRPGLLMLRQALRQSGHDAVIANYSTSLMARLNPASLVARSAAIFERSIRPFFLEGKKPLRHPLSAARSLFDIKELKFLAREQAAAEKNVIEELGRELIEQVRAEQFDAVGFSLFFGGSTVAAIRLAEILRAAEPSLPIIFGGPQTTHFSETIFQVTGAPTALALGEGEQAIVGIADIIEQLKAGRLNDLSRVPNVVYKDKDGRLVATTRSRLPLNDWVRLSADVYEERDFEGLMRYAFIETSRGCPWLCNFCSQPLLSGTKRNIKPAKNVADEMLSLNQRFGLTHFELVGSSTPPRQAEEIADELITRGLGQKFNWVAFMRGRDQSAEERDNGKLMGKLRRAGASALFFGAEAADDATLKLMGKNESVAEIESMMQAAGQAGIATIASFIYPYPGMPKNEADLIVKFLEDTQPLSAPAQALGLYPGTDSANRANEIGCEIVYPKRWDRWLARAGLKAPATMDSPEVLQYLLTYPLILSLPMKFWPPLPWKIDGKDFSEYVGAVNKLQRRISGLGILSGFSHSHFLISQVLQTAPKDLAAKMFYLSLTGDPAATKKMIGEFNAQAS
jgi:radical SAM superfamily enzyme YgiQ (UPF0313 family)